MLKAELTAAKATLNELERECKQIKDADKARDVKLLEHTKDPPPLSHLLAYCSFYRPDKVQALQPIPIRGLDSPPGTGITHRIRLAGGRQPADSALVYASLRRNPF